jgi:short-subunit dehydrogenase
MFAMAKTPRSLAGTTVAITGGARGIGRATAAALIAQGARVAVGDIDSALAEQTATELGAGTIGLPLDVTERASFARFLDEVENRLGPLEVVINNAGIMPIGPFVQESDAIAERMIDINLYGVIFGSKLALERFIPRRRGHLVNIASMAGKMGLAGGVTYCATKHAVVGLSEGLRAELRDTGVDISVVMPVVVHTELGSGLPETRGFKAVEPEDVANAIVEALQTGRFEVYVPKSGRALVRFGALMPRRVMEFLGRLLKGDEVLTHPDAVARAAYEARIAGSPPTVSTSSAQRVPETERPVEATPASAADAETAAAPTVDGPAPTADQAAPAADESAPTADGPAVAADGAAVVDEPAPLEEAV